MLEQVIAQSLPDGILNVFKLLGIDPPKGSSYALPSEYLGDGFQLDRQTIARLEKKLGVTDEKFHDLFAKFERKYRSQRVFRHNVTDLNIFFCDFMMSARKKLYSISNYFDFEFYLKSIAEQATFWGQGHRVRIRTICNRYSDIKFLRDKALFNAMYREYVRREWIDLLNCSPTACRAFIEKHPRFFVKNLRGSLGRGAEIVEIERPEDIDAAVERLAGKRMIMEEVIAQHEALAEFCPDTLNTVRINTFLDKHNRPHLLTACGRFGRRGKVVDNFHGGGYSVTIDPETGVIISDGLNRVHERRETHADSGKKFRGFQYPCWDKLRAAVLKMAKVMPTLRHIGWDVAITADGEIELVEGNQNPDTDVQQAADSIGRLHLYKDLVAELEQFNRDQIKVLGWRINSIDDFEASYQKPPTARSTRVPVALELLVRNCKSLIDVGCRADKFVKTLLPSGIKYYPVDFQRYDDSSVERESDGDDDVEHDAVERETVERETVERETVEREAVERPTVDDETIVCDFNAGEFPNIRADTCLSIITAEYVEQLPEFLDNICRAAMRQVLIVARPIDREARYDHRWRNPFPTDFTEEFLIGSITKNNFYLRQWKVVPNSRSIVLYDFRRK